MLKKWMNPEMRVFSVKMNENIATSGELVTDNEKYETGFLYYDLGGITRGGANYRYKGNNVQDTSVTWKQTGNQKVITKNEVDLVVGCLA